MLGLYVFIQTRDMHYFYSDERASSGAISGIYSKRNLSVTRTTGETAILPEGGT
jgi:hypothetical protein